MKRRSTSWTRIAARVYAIELLKLAERKEDIPLLARHSDATQPEIGTSRSSRDVGQCSRPAATP